MDIEIDCTDDKQLYKIAENRGFLLRYATSITTDKQKIEDIKTKFIKDYKIRCKPQVSKSRFTRTNKIKLSKIVPMNGGNKKKKKRKFTYKKKKN